jgi:hypothetical protein
MPETVVMPRGKWSSQNFVGFNSSGYHFTDYRAGIGTDPECNTGGLILFYR